MSETQFEALFDRHAPAVLSYLLRRTDRASAEDALSETFLVTWRRRGDVPSEPLPWLYGVARRVLANQSRGDARRVALAYKLTREPRFVGSADELSDATLAALQSLSAADREILLLDAWEELSRTDGAAVLGCLPAAYGVRLHRASQRFKAAYARRGAASVLSSRTAESPS